MQTVLSLAQALAWPVVVVVLLLYFGKPIKHFLDQAAEFSFKAGGVEAKLTRQPLEAAASLGAALASKQVSDTSENLKSVEHDLRDIAQAVAETVTARASGRLQGTAILWVDDRPRNNVYEQSALRALGFEIDISTSTDDALKKTQRKKYDIVISDMSRPPDDGAGYTLLAALQTAGLHAPYILYSGTDRPEYRIEARRRGAFGSTNDPQELIELVTRAVERTNV